MQCLPRVPGCWEASFGCIVSNPLCEAFDTKKPRKTCSLFSPHPKLTLPTLSCVAIFDLVPMADIPSSDLFPNSTMPCNPRCLKFPGPKLVLQGHGPMVHQSFSFAILPPGGRSCVADPPLEWLWF